MMETLSLNATDNQIHQTTLQVVSTGVLGNHHHHSPVDEEHMMNLSDMTDLSQEIEDIDGYVPMAKEVIFISLVSQEQALYNPKHENYRNTHKRDMKWMEIAERVGWSEMQCKSKWKAMRDQYCRELKRSKSNAKANIKWKYFKELDFLRPYALARNYRPRNSPATNSNINNNNNNFNCSPGTNTANGISTEPLENNESPRKFPSIKLESGTRTTINFTNCDFSPSKSDNSNNLTEEQLTNVLQQQNDDNNWNYITGTNSNSAANSTRLDNHTLSDTQHLLSVHHQQNHHSQQQQQTATDEAFYNALVDCVGQIQQQQQQQQQQQLCQQQNTPTQDHHQAQQLPSTANNNNNNDEEDDDPIHTFLNIESYFEKELIALIRNEDVLYNSSNVNYRNVKLKLAIWDEIARKLKKTVKQCRLKWKALRDQFIREHKRLKNRNDIETLSKWKHYDALIFLQNFMKQKPNLNFSEFSLNKDMLQIMPKTEIDTDINEENEQLNISNSSPLRTPLENIKCDLSEPQLQMQDISGVNNDQTGIQQTTDHTDNLCVDPASVGGYDDMDIDNYIIGDSGSVVNEPNEEDNETDAEEDRKSKQKFSMFNSHNTSIANDMGTTTAIGQTSPAFKDPQQQQQHTQHINMPTLDLNEATASALINPDNLNANTNSNNSYQQNHLANTNNITLASAVASLDLCNVATAGVTATATTSTQHQQQLPPTTPTTCEASTNTPPLPDNSNNNCTNNTNANFNKFMQLQEDDEVGAFFKAIAMKIRNAKLSPVAFTDLQIDILRVINSSLRNH